MRPHVRGHPPALVAQRLARLNADPGLAAALTRARTAMAPDYVSRPADGVILGYGTGFMISPRLLLPFDPEQLIREDLRIGQERMCRTRELMQHEAGFSFERLQEAIDQLEASLPCNCEHVVSQSWFGNKEPMRGDLHHLFA